MFKTIVSALIGAAYVSAQQKLKDISFDLSAMQQYPSGWDTYGAAVPLKSQVKITPPQVNNVAGQMFLYEHLKTPAWEADFKVMTKGYSQFNQLPKDEPLDIFAIWYLISDPKKLADPKAIGPHMQHFGYNRRYNGMGLFLYRSTDGQYKFVAKQDMGLQRLDIQKFDELYKAGLNGCIVPDHLLQTGFVVQIKQNQSMISIQLKQTHQRDGRALDCFKDLYMSNIQAKAYLGITARNSDKAITDVSVESIKVINNDPTAAAYKDQASEKVKGRPTGQSQPDAPSKMQYTDQMEKEASDIFDAYAQQERMLERYIAEYPGNLREQDQGAEMLFKMNEHVKHVNHGMGRFISLEAQMSQFIKDHSALPTIMESFESIPESLHKHLEFARMLETQLDKILDDLPSVLELVLSIQQEKNERNDDTTIKKLNLPKEFERSLNYVKAKTTSLKKDFEKLVTEQAETIKLLEAVMALEPEQGSNRAKNAEMEKLARFEGEGWSDDVLDYVLKESNWAKRELIARAQESSQSRSIVQVIMIALASFSIAMVWLKMTNVSKKLLL